MESFSKIAEKTLKLATDEKTDAETMLKALQASQTARELDEKVVEGAFARAARSWGPVVAPYMAGLAVLFSIFTLVYQSWDQHKAAEQSEWRDALKVMSVKDDSSALSTIYQMQSFFSSERYGTESRSVAVMVLPDVASYAGFDSVLADLRQRSTPGNEKDLVKIARIVVDEDWNLYRKAVEKHNLKARFIDFILDPTRSIPNESEYLAGLGGKGAKGDTNLIAPGDEYERDAQFHPLKRANLCSWKIDSISKEFAILWKDRRTNPGPAQLGLTGVVLERKDALDLRSVDFSNTRLDLMIFHNADLAGANFDGAILTHTIFSKISSFSGSQWQSANWWETDAPFMRLGPLSSSCLSSPSITARLDKKCSEARPRSLHTGGPEVT